MSRRRIIWELLVVNLGSPPIGFGVGALLDVWLPWGVSVDFAFLSMGTLMLVGTLAVVYRSWESRQAGVRRWTARMVGVAVGLVLGGLGVVLATLVRMGGSH